MDAEVISIGDEMTTGQRLDTNSQWLSQRLIDLGVRVKFHTTVGDDLADNVLVFRQACERVDLVISTGGLGPTADDLTRDALAQLTGRELYRDEAAEAHIRNLFARRKRPMPERNLVQAMFPRGTRVIPNPHGSAPGIDLDVERAGRKPARIFALPGVPAEMKEMWELTVAPAVAASMGDQRRCIRIRTLNCFGVGESDLEAMLPDLIRRGREPTVGITVSKATISLRIVADAVTEAECDRQIAEASRVIQQHLGELIFGEGEEELQHVAVRLCRDRGITLGVAEAGSGGLLTEWLAEADPSHQVFLGGFVPCCRPARTPEETLELAQSARSLLGADLGLAIGSFPITETAAGIAGEYYVALATSSTTQTIAFPFTGHPEILVPRAVKQALNALRRKLLQG